MSSVPTRRHRSRSIVQSIAAHIPVVPNHLDMALNSPVQNGRLIPQAKSDALFATSYSTDHLSQPKIKHLISVSTPDDCPLTGHRFEQFWSQFVESFEYNVLVDEEVENSVFNSQISEYLKYQNDLILKHSNNQNLLSKTDRLLSSLENLHQKYYAITNDTKEFQEESNQLIDEFNDLNDFNKILTEYLFHFESLNEINSFLNKPGLNRIIKSTKFLTILKNLDSSLKFLNDNPDFKDADSYKFVLQSSLTKALTLLKNYINNSLNHQFTLISNQLTKINILTSDVLFYKKFESNSYEINKLMLIFYERQQLYPGEYEGLITDIFNTYFNIRNKLLSTILKNHFNEINQNNFNVTGKSLIQYFQDNLNFFINLVDNEYELYYKFFNDFSLTKLQKKKLSIADQSLNFNENLSMLSSSSTLNLNNSVTNLSINDDYFSDPNFNYQDFLEFASPEFFNWCESSLLETLYDQLRQRILKENDISTLCQLISLLQKYYNEDEIEEDVEPQNWKKYNINFAKEFNPILTDIQSRLIFKVQVYVEENIVKYKPKLDDFKPVNEIENINEDLNEENLLLSNIDSQYYQGWYPTLKVSIQLLSQIQQLVNSTIFDDLAHNIVHLCIQSIKQAFEFCSKIHGIQNSQLFLIKNFLILKKNIEHFDIEYPNYTDIEFDFSGLQNLFQKGWTKGTTLGQIAPKIVSNMYDAKLELQLELRDVVHLFIRTIVNKIMQSLEGCKKLDNLSQVVELMNDFRSIINEEFHRLKDLLDIYKIDHLISGYLIDGIRELLISDYDEWYNEQVKTQSNNGGNKILLNDLLEVDGVMVYLGQISTEVFGFQDSNNDENKVDDDDLNGSFMNRRSIEMVQDLSDIEN